MGGLRNEKNSISLKKINAKEKLLVMSVNYKRKPKKKKNKLTKKDKIYVIFALIFVVVGILLSILINLGNFIFVE
jgi:hypothetical protein